MRMHPLQTLAFTVALAGLLCAGPSTADAHLMVAQTGTLNVRDNGSYLMVSVPVSAFSGLDDDGDGRCSEAELARHHAELVPRAVAGMQLFDVDGPLALEGVLFNLSAVHGTQATAQHLVMMGRFEPSPMTSDYRLRTDLFGPQEGQGILTLKVVRGEHEQKIALSRSAPEVLLFPSAWSGFKARLHNGVVWALPGMVFLVFLALLLSAERWLRRLGPPTPVLENRS